MKRFLLLLVSGMFLAAASTSYASSDAKIYGCVSDNGGGLRVTSGPGTCTKMETPIFLSAYTGLDFVQRGHVRAAGFATDGDAWPGFTVQTPYGGTGVYWLSFNLSTSNLPDCTVTSPAPVQCSVSDKASGRVTVSCVQPTIAADGTLTYVPANTDFEFICVE
jgi:hypothetical protein